MASLFEGAGRARAMAPALDQLSFDTYKTAFEQYNYDHGTASLVRDSKLNALWGTGRRSFSSRFTTKMWTPGEPLKDFVFFHAAGPWETSFWTSIQTFVDRFLPLQSFRIELRGRSMYIPFVPGDTLASAVWRSAKIDLSGSQFWSHRTRFFADDDALFFDRAIFQIRCFHGCSLDENLHCAEPVVEQDKVFPHGVSEPPSLRPCVMDITTRSMELGLVEIWCVPPTSSRFVVIHAAPGIRIADVVLGEFSLPSPWFATLDGKRIDLDRQAIDFSGSVIRIHAGYLNGGAPARVQSRLGLSEEAVKVFRQSVLPYLLRPCICHLREGYATALFRHQSDIEIIGNAVHLKVEHVGFSYVAHAVLEVLGISECENFAHDRIQVVRMTDQQWKEQVQARPCFFAVAGHLSGPKLDVTHGFIALQPDQCEDLGPELTISEWFAGAFAGWHRAFTL